MGFTGGGPKNGGSSRLSSSRLSSSRLKEENNLVVSTLQHNQVVNS
jgi:hypothetical protein